MTTTRNRPFPTMPLRLALIIPFVLIVLVTVASVGYIAFMNGQQAVNDVARRLRSEMSARIESHLHSFMGIPHQVNQVTLAALQHGWLDPQDTSMLQTYFLEQVKAHPTLTSVYFGSAAGGIAGSGREGPAGALYVYGTDNLTGGIFNKYAVTDAGVVGGLLTSLPNFDARTRPWYRGATGHGTAVWNDIYILFTGQDLTISASSPVYDVQHRLLGVVAVDIFLSQIENFLATVDISQAGQIFIMERSGLLVATSTGEKPFVTNNDQVERLDARHSQSPVTTAAAEILRGRFGKNYAITAAEQVDFELAGERYFLSVSPIQDDYGLDWLSVVVIPESDFMAAITATNRSTLLIALLALGIAIVASILLAQRIAGRMAALNASIHAFTVGVGAGPTVDSSHLREIDELIASFLVMKQQLRQQLTDLQAEIGTRQRAEEALRENRQFLSDLIELNGALIYVKDRAGRYELINRKWEIATGLSRDRVIGQTDTTLFPGPVGEQFRQNDLKVFESGSVIEEEERLEDPQGTRYFISIKFPLRDEHDRVKGLCGVTTEITERKQAEEALRESQSLYQSLVEGSPLSVCRKDLAGRFTFANQRFLDESQISLTDLIGKTDWNLHPPELAEKYRQDDLAVMADGQVREAVEARAILGGESVVVQSLKAPIYDGAGKVNGVQISFWDITARQQAESQRAVALASLRDLNATLEQRVADRTAELQSANARLTELDHLKNEFLSRISHELRTPLSGILLAFELLETARPEKRERYMQRIKQSAHRLREMIEDVLMFAQLNRDLNPDMITPINLNDVIESRLTTWHQLSAEHNLQFHLDLAHNLPHLHTDSDLIGQAISRLVVNAVNYTPAGSVRVSTALRTEFDQAWITISVQDTGPGITPEDLPHIFERFYRGRAAADYKTPGTGIGLSISREIAEKLGGRLTVDTQIGVGSTFTLWLRAV